MSNPRYGGRSDISATVKIGLSNGSLDSRASKEHGGGLNKKSSRVKKSVYLWTPTDVRSWLQKKHRDYFERYYSLFLEHDISGRALVRLNELKLERMGIENKEHRIDLHEQILKLRIKHEQNELRLLRKTDVVVNKE
nr:protein aveugle-like [Lytechinus pictus]